jgi:hypothetical protein
MRPRSSSVTSGQTTSASLAQAVRAWLTGALLLTAPCAASAQVATMHDIVDLLVTNQSVQTGDFVKDRAAADAASAALGDSLLVSLATLPTSASSAGFTYRFNPSLGTLERTSTSFGPSFIERAVTSGKGRAAFGTTWQYASFTRLDNRHLHDEGLVTTANRFVDEPAAFDVERLTLTLRSQILTGFATVGVADRFDVAVAVPFVWLDLEGTRVDTYRGTSVLQAQATATSSGFGDVALRAKYNFFERGGTRLAAAGEVLLPTGREEDLLGAGRSATRLMAVASFEREYVGVHGNLAFGFGGVSDEINYSAALTVAPAPRVTVAAEFIGRHLSDIGRISEVTAPHPLISGVETVRLSAGDLGMDVVNAGGSFKWNVGGAWLVRASVLMPGTSAGLTSRMRTTIGIDYAFGQ